VFILTLRLRPHWVIRSQSDDTAGCTFLYTNCTHTHTHTCHSPQRIDFLHILDCEIHVSKILSIYMSIVLNPMVIFNIFCAALILRHCNRHNTSAKHAAYLQSVGWSLVLWWKKLRQQAHRDREWNSFNLINNRR
jgi:hypothetical protein